MAKPDKVAAVAEIAESFRTSSATVVTQYTGLSVSQLSQLRRALGTSAKYRVAKNTLVKRAAEDAGIQGLEDLFVGATAIAFVEGEAVDAAKALRDFAKDNNALVIKGGYMDGRALSVDEINRIADLDSREVLLSKAAGAFKAKLSQAAALFQAPASQVARLAAALEEKQREATGTEAAEAPAES
ncbi:50S ribosomal protein L10 [Amycolatopsis sp. H6(2020)]|nr:50S ribosomal protein L10 [Amycolatopsis sp. H6(2020)]